MTRILTTDGVEEQLRKHHGNMAAVGRHFGVSRSAVRQFVAKYPSLAGVVDDCREAMKDDAESVLFKAVKKGEAWAVCFYLKTQARDRGYIERPPDTASPTAVEDFLAAVDERRKSREAATANGHPG